MYVCVMQFYILVSVGFTFGIYTGSLLSRLLELCIPIAA